MNYDCKWEYLENNENNLLKEWAKYYEYMVNYKGT